MKSHHFEELLLVMLRNATAVEIKRDKIVAKYREGDLNHVGALPLHTCQLIRLLRHYSELKLEGDVGFKNTASGEVKFTIDFSRSHEFIHCNETANETIAKYHKMFSRAGCGGVERGMLDFFELHVKRIIPSKITSGEMLQVETVEWIMPPSYEFSVIEWMSQVLKTHSIITNAQRGNTLYFEFRCYKAGLTAEIINNFKPHQPVAITVADA